MADSKKRLQTMVDELEELLAAALTKRPEAQPTRSNRRSARTNTPDDGPRITGTGAPAVNPRPPNETRPPGEIRPPSEDRDTQADVSRSPSGTLFGVAPVSVPKTDQGPRRRER
ncbi:MAG: hypothetical protein KC503_38415 [Myxococcales bacterium]|nr:hypothetical protein [Myxococcales bacterium]